eukprot:CAMPEP_0116866658 /NCGR_PEP_ID=MMETSP0418-20121206/26154_1 /TAXON_ID=1158023 /ORGANISM="Astrosyne radiata, Strain 13vi08-1A" /LENGTH=53 /DNA_ID=CAMNT_0004502323 /DNA_START=11 /DNA_END=169 /DNA_ORIENTATION=-
MEKKPWYHDRRIQVVIMVSLVVLIGLVGGIVAGLVVVNSGSSNDSRSSQGALG